jgi:deoxycytidylate deaminase
VRQPQVENPELVLGLAAGVGTPLEEVQETLRRELSRLAYEADIVHLSHLTRRFRLPTPTPARSSGEAARIDAWMDRGNEARLATGRNDVLALLAIGEIHVRRPTDRAPLAGHAFILRQLKQPEEVYLLRETYGSGFHLIGAYCPRTVRERFLRKRGVSKADVERLIDRDEHEPSIPGQHLRDTFHLSDVFIEVDEQRANLRRQIQRFLLLLFGIGIKAPSRDEFGMFYAHASALRSSQLGRQVGAAILGPRGDVLAVGANEVPRFGGGTYLEGDGNDCRDHVRGRDSSDELREKIVAEITERLHPRWSKLGDEGKRRLLLRNLKRLRGTTVSALTEFGRAVHAEAEAILSAARMGTSMKGADLFCTTFPCHVCAKHIVAAGIASVTFIEPYPKSRAVALHPDSISLERGREGTVPFRPFVGIAPRRYPTLFAMRSEDGRDIRRKDERGVPIVDQRNLRLRMPYFSALEREKLAADQLQHEYSKAGGKR